MNDFKYNLSVVMPIYNAQTYIKESLESLLNQEDKTVTFEVLMLNDGSVDNSEVICKEYSEKYDNFKYIYKENSGVSDTRNMGLDLAKGKYILFLDADDMLTPETFGSVFRLFERFQDESSILAYQLNTYIDGEVNEHLRSGNYYTEGIFHIDNFPTLNQCTINTVVKNLPQNERCYFNKNLKQCEDALFNTQMVMKQKKIIISSKGTYLYRTEHKSTVNMFANPAAIKNMLFDFFYELIKMGEKGQIHPYIQSMILYEINWRFKGNVLYPNYLKKEEREKWDGSFQEVMDSISVEAIMNQNFMDIYHKYYFIDNYKKNITMNYDSAGINFYSNKDFFLTVKQFDLVFSRMTNKNNKIQIFGFLKAPMMQYLEEDLKLVIRKNDKEDKEITLRSNSPEGYYKSKVSIAHFYDVNFSFSLDEDAYYEFWVIYKGIEYKVNNYFRNSVYFPKEIELLSTVINNKVLSYQVKNEKDNFRITVSSDATKIKETQKTLIKQLTSKTYVRLFSFYNYYQLTKKYII